MPIVKRFQGTASQPPRGQTVYRPTAEQLLEFPLFKLPVGPLDELVDSVHHAMLVKR